MATSHKADPEQISAEIESLGYKLIQYNNANSVIISDADGYKYNVTMSNLRKGRKPRMLYHNPYSLDNLRRFVEVKSGGTVHLISTEYQDCKKPLDIVCDVHRDKGVQHVNADSIVNSGTLCKYCGRHRAQLHKMDSPYTIRSLCEQHDLIVKNIFLKDGQTHVSFICKKHESYGEQVLPWWRLKNSSHWCRFCSGRGLSDSDYKRIVAKLHPDIKVLGEYTRYDKRIRCHCKTCGHEWSTRAGQLKSNRLRGCPECGKVKSGLSKRRTQEEIEASVAESNPNLLVIGEYTGYHEPIRCKCLVHGTEFSANVCNIINGTATCPDCGEGIGKSESTVIEQLKQFGFQVLPHHKFDDCRYKKVLEFDAYLPECNTVVEYDGEQHYGPVDYFASSHSEAVSNYEVDKIRDKIKDDYCASNGIAMIRIPYWERKNIHDFLVYKFDELGITIPVV